MRKIIFPFLLLLLFTSSNLLAVDNYWVVLAKGSVYKEGSDKAIKVGDKIDADLKLRFSTKDSYIIVMGPKGKFTLKPVVNKSNQNEFMVFVKSSLLPVKSTGRLSTRGEESGVSDLGNYFGEDSFALVGNNFRVKLNPKNYELNNEKFIIYRYESNGLVTSKKLAFEGTEIIFDKIALYKNHQGKDLNPAMIKKVDLYKFDASTNSSSKIVSFQPVFVNEEELKEQLASVYKICKEELNADKIKTEDELIKFVLDIYGRTDEGQLKKWLTKNIIN